MKEDLTSRLTPYSRPVQFGAYSSANRRAAKNRRQPEKDKTKVRQTRTAKLRDIVIGEIPCRNLNGDYIHLEVLDNEGSLGEECELEGLGMLTWVEETTKGGAPGQK